MSQGFVYVLVSPNSSYIKIGGTERPIRERLRAINATAHYADHGPWNPSVITNALNRFSSTAT